MASVNLNALTEVQKPASTDNLLLFNETSNVATRIDYDKLAEAILNKTRDEIGGVSPISAIATLNSRYTTLNKKFGIALGNDPNFNNIVEQGFYYFGDVANAVNPPNKDAGYLNMLVLRVGDMVTQVVFGGRQLSQGGRDKIWVRYRNGNSDSDWNRWVTYATQSEVDALEARVTALENK